LEDFKASVDISTLKRGMLEALNQIQKAPHPFQIEMANRFLKDFWLSAFSHDLMEINICAEIIR